MRLLVVLLALVCVVSCKYLPNRGPKEPVPSQFTGEWAVKVSPGADPKFLYDLGFTTVKPIANLKGYYTVSYGDMTALSSVAHVEAVETSLRSRPDVTFVQKQHKKRMFSRVDVPADPLFPDQWHLKNTGQFGGTPSQDVNVTGAWALGYTGNGVRIAVVDDGYQYIHPDLAPGYVASSSYNFNSDTPDPAPSTSDYHGTAAAGVALARNNSACGVGAAFMAEGSGIRLISSFFSDADTANALTYVYQENDIYTNSWGPVDSGRIHEGPGPLTTLALEDAVANGRGGLGSIYVWAAGNGLQNEDNCNFDGFVNSRYTIGVGAVDLNGVQSYYSEPCAAMLVTAPSSGSSVGITTTDYLGTRGYSSTNCTDDFGGTSSATPLVAGIIALMLEANPNLTWRDVQYILLSTAVKNDPNDTDWSVNGAGYHINHKYGFGRVDAYQAVVAAQSFVSVPPAFTVAQSQLIVNQSIPEGGPFLNATVNVQGYLTLEHVEVSVHIPNYWQAGDLEIVLISPSGTQSILSEQHGQINAFYTALPTHPELDEFPAFIVESPYGPWLRPLNGTGVLVLTAPDTTVCGMANITNCADLAGKIAVFDNADCWTSTQAYSVQLCNASAAFIIMNIAGEPDFEPDNGPYEWDVDIPTVMIDLGSGITIKALLANESNSLPLSIVSLPSSRNLTFNGWTFSTVRNWGETSDGVWTLQVADMQKGDNGQLLSWDLNLFGTAVCPSGCNNGGVCGGPNTCNCTAQWAGATCETPVCAQGCLNGGLCVSPGQCNCTAGWTDDDCNTAVCSQGCWNGNCAQPDQCNCTAGWTGASCDTATCDAGCINGACAAPNTCKCIPGWNGTSCQEAVCTQGCNNGICALPEQCNCTTGWSGDSCLSAICASGCGENGACTAPNTCRCFDGYEGDTCQNKRKVYKDYRVVGGVMGALAGVAFIAVGVLLYKRYRTRTQYMQL